MGRVESYFLKANSLDGNLALWIKFTALNSNSRPLEYSVWAIYFERSKKPIVIKDDFDLAYFAPPHIEIGNCVMSNNHTNGKVGSLSWDFDFTSTCPKYIPLPYKWMYNDQMPFPKTKLTTPHPYIVLKGDINVNGQNVSVDNWVGAIGHNWGKQHAPEYVWAHCNFDNGYFEGFSAKVNVGPILIPTLTITTIMIDGIQHTFNNVKSMVKYRCIWDANAATMQWWFDNGKLMGTIIANSTNVAKLRYENPNGQIIYCLNSKQSDLRLNYNGREFTSNKCALEIGTRTIQTKAI